jgi:hypothetical protein
MSNPGNLLDANPFDDETWQMLPDFLAHLPKPVCLHIWGDESAGQAEHEAVRLAQALASRFPQISYRVFPRRINYPYYPVIGIMGGTPDDAKDYGLRIIGLPAGYQMTSLIAAIQAVSFEGQTLEPMTRIKLHKLLTNDEVITNSEAITNGGAIDIELLTSAGDLNGSVAAKTLFGAAMAGEQIRTFLIVTDFFPEAGIRYTAEKLPHVVINRRFHFEGILSEEMLVDQIIKVLRGGETAKPR